MRNRSERRKDPDQWWEVTAYGNEARAFEVGADQTVYIQDINNTTVVKLPPSFQTLVPKTQQEFIEALQAALKAGGIEHAVIVPDDVQFLRMTPVSFHKGKQLDIKARAGSRKDTKEMN